MNDKTDNIRLISSKDRDEKLSEEEELAKDSMAFREVLLDAGYTKKEAMAIMMFAFFKDYKDR